MSETKNLIIFFAPVRKSVNGGVMSIFSLCKESRRFHKIHKSEVIICTFPGNPSYKKNDLFDNDEYIFDFEEVTKKYKNTNHLLMHIPENAINQVYGGLKEYEKYLNSIKKISINIMNQNIRYMPTAGSISKLYTITNIITQTTAHDRYSSQEMCDKFSLPLKHLSVFIDPGNYKRIGHETKSNIIAYSPDLQPEKAAIVNALHSNLPNYEFIEIKNLDYISYRALSSKAKFVITFGEGFDGYLIESVFSGGIPFAVYNEDFFPSPGFKKYPNIYTSYDDMLKNICDDILALDTNTAYTSLNKKLTNKLSEFYNFSNYLNKIEDFYLGQYDFEPSGGSLVKFLSEGIKDIDAELNEIKKNNLQIMGDLETNNIVLKKEVLDLKNSRSWKITKPIRYINKAIKQISNS